MSKSLRILLVEDHADTLSMMLRLLRAFQHQVHPAESVSAALALAGGNQFDLVISDLGLPDGSGLKLMSELRDKYGLKGIALTGYGDVDDISAATESGFVTHLTKPV